MAAPTAIADAGETLVDLLIDQMDASVNDKQVVLSSPERVKDNDTVRLTVYLYDVSQNAHMQNKEPPLPPDATVRPGDPLRLDLRYLVTAYPSTGNGDETANTAAQHEVLGDAMRVLNDNPVVAGTDLAGAFEGDDALYVSEAEEAMDTVVSVWNTFGDRPYRPSVAYLVTPVVIDSAHEEAVGRVEERELAGPSGGGDGP